MSKKKITLKRNIIVNSLITIIIPIVLFGFFSALVYINNYAETTASKNKIIADTLRDQFITILQEPLNLLSLTEDELLILSNQPNEYMNSYLNNIVSNYDYVNNIEVINSEGIVLYSGINQAHNIGSNRTGEVFYEYFMHNEGTFWSSPYISPATEQLTIQISKKNTAGRYITVYINLQTLSNASLEFTESFSEDLDIAITDQYGIYISHSDITKVYTRLFEPNIEEIRELVTSEENFRAISYQDILYTVSSSKMRTTGWYVIIYQPYSTTFAFVYELILLLTLIIVIGIVIAMLYAFAYARRIDVFIKSMNSEIESAAANDYKIALPEFDFEDFNRIGVNFNQLMTEVRRRDDKLYHMAYNDALTGLGNRAYLIDRMEDRIKHDPDSSFSYIHMDIDNFKMINDLYGHEIGDQLLLTLSSMLRDRFGASSGQTLITRIGGDEFGILAASDYSGPQLRDIMGTISQELASGLFISGKIITTTLSTGITHYPEHAKALKSLLQNSDIALQEAKSSGKNRVIFFAPEMKEKIHKRSSMEELLRRGLKHQMFELHFQPQILTEEGSIDGFEALVRLRDASGELIPPYQFISIAEETGIIIELGEWVLEEAIRKLKQINEYFDTDYNMSVNLSAVQMGLDSFAESAFDIIDRSGIDKGLVELEITESVFIKNYTVAKSIMQNLYEHGIRFALDDFGTGYSSLAYLSNLPFDILKIDRTFIADVENDASKLRMLQSILSLGHQLNLAVVAEGVETMDQMDIVTQHGCDRIQGYLYSRPLPYDQLIQYIENFKDKKNRSQS